MPFAPVRSLPTADLASIALCGPEGSGKTLTALKIARGICGPKGRIAVIDTENGKSRKFRRFEDFDVEILTDNFAPAKYVELIHEAEKAKYDVLVIDSLTHAWSGRGGVLEMKDEEAKKTGNDLNAWRKVSPEHNRLVDALTHCKCHVNTTLRDKTEFAVEQYTDHAGRTRTRVRKLGLAPIQRDGMMYEFDLVGDFDDNHTLTFTKSRCPEMDKASFDFTDLNRGLVEAENIGKMIGHWCETGVGLTKADFVAQEIRRVAVELGRDADEVEMMVAAADGDIAALDTILAELRGTG
jgi:DNA polymerase III delta prime subunit